MKILKQTLRHLWRSNTRPSIFTGSNIAHGDSERILTPTLILNQSERHKTVQLMASLTGVPSPLFNELYLASLHRLAGLFQLLPSEFLHAKGTQLTLLDRALSLSAGALRIRQGYLLPPGGEAEVISQQHDLWTYGVFTAALLNGIGGSVNAYQVNLFSLSGSRLGVWHPLAGPMHPDAFSYRLEPRFDESASDKGSLALVLSAYIIPPSGLAWIASAPQLLSLWLGAVKLHLEDAGVLGKILKAAGADFELTTPRATSIEPTCHVEKPPEFKTPSPPKTEHESNKTVAIDPLTAWIRTQIATDRMSVNLKNSVVRMIPEGVVLVSPQIFKDYATSIGEPSKWKRFQKSFLKLRLHRKNSAGGHFHRFDLNIDSHVSGLLIPDISYFFPDQQPPFHPSMRLVRL